MPATKFYSIPSTQSNIDFENTLDESDDFNIIEYLYFYNGAGVAIGDINNDGLPDLYFSSNQHPNKLYLNKGGFHFEDITLRAGVGGEGNWKTGVTMADVNGDGLLDIFSCGVGSYKKFKGRNQLFINNGDLTFTDMTTSYGLDFKGFSTQASFFDYDNDGDLDMFLVNHAVHTTRSYGHAMLRYQSDPFAGDKLYRNEFIPSGSMRFTEVTSQAGILNSQIGYGLAVGISDLNRDGYLDIYVSNDFNENDYLYINQGNGTFRQELEKAIPHSSRFSMGNDIADINNDGWTDILTLDMLPKDEEVIKTTAGEDSYEIYDFRLKYGYHYQFLRNALQLNQGLDAQGNLMFSDIAPLAGVEATDWSWSPTLADFDNDGNKDLFITNGIVGRPNDLDYINYISHDSAQRFFSDQQLSEQMPSGKVPNVFFRNDGDLTFSDVTNAWTGGESSLSNGAAYGDLDNDGDLDLVVNNINGKPFIYRNDIAQDSGGYVNLIFQGEEKNSFGIGVSVMVYAGNRMFFQEQIPTRGWLSSVDYKMHVGVGNVPQIDSMLVSWPGNTSQWLYAIKVNATVTLKKSESLSHNTKRSPKAIRPLLAEQDDIPFKHRENDFISFNAERPIPDMLSTEGPALAIGDVNGDKLDDVFVGGATGQEGAIFIQQIKGTFGRTSQPAIAADSLAEDTDAILFDADGNGSQDLMVVSGGQQFGSGSVNLMPRLYINDGRGKFAKGKLPAVYVNASCIRASDIDDDGDMDVFIGGSVVPGKYGLDPPVFLWINDGNGNFEDRTKQLWPTSSGDLVLPGMVNDALWADVNGDKREDLIMVGSWMPVTVLIQNDSGYFKDMTKAFGLAETNGWWHSVAAQDMDGDGDVDLIAGNAGLNCRLRPSEKEPVGMLIGDIDGNNSLDHLLTYYNHGIRYPFISRDQLVKQVPSLKKRFLKYSSYKDVRVEDILSPDQQEKFIHKEAFTFASSYIENLGNGKFEVTPLPLESQVFPIYAICIEDIDGDGSSDLLVAGNLTAVQPDIGRFDGGYGLLLKGNGKGQFTAQTAQASGFVVKGQARDIKKARGVKRKLFVSSRNNDTPKVYQRTQH